MVKMSWQLTTGALATIMCGGTVDNPVLQILGSSRITSSSSERYQLLVSDGCHLNWFALLATHLNDALISGQLSDYSVVRINRMYTTVVNKLGRSEIYRCVIIINDLTILASGREVGVRIGNPVAFPGGSSSAVELPAPAQSKPQLTAFTGDTHAQPLLPEMEVSSPADGLNDSLSPFQIKSLKQVLHSIHDISLEINRKFAQMQYNVEDLLNAYNLSFTNLKKTVEDSVQNRNKGLLMLHDNLSSPRHRFIPLIQNLMAENVAFAHLVAKQGQRNRTIVLAFIRSHSNTLLQLRQFLSARLHEVQEMVEKIEEDH